MIAVTIIVAVLFYLYFVWRVVHNVRRRMPIQADVSWLTFLTACGLLSILFWIAPPVSQPVAAAILAAALVIVAAVNLYIFRRYEKWLQKENETE